VAADACGTAIAPPSQYQHVIWIWFENKTLPSVIGTSEAPFMTQLAKQGCGYGSRWLDDVLNLPSEPNYVAAAAGANCDSGTLHTQTPVGDRCVTGDGAPASTCLSTTCQGTIATSSIFEQLQRAGATWNVYAESMSSNCSTANPSGRYYVKHNPAPLFSHLRVKGRYQGNTCAADDVPFASTTCGGTSCLPAGPGNNLANDLARGSLPSLSVVVPNICNDMHDTCSPYASSAKNGDDWLRAWLPMIVESQSYVTGTTAVFVLWDEGAFGAPLPNMVVAPSVRPGTVVGATINNIAVLRATEDMLGLPHLNCATGRQRNGAACPAGSTADLRKLFGI